MAKAKGKTLDDFNLAHNPDVKIPAAIAAGLVSLLAEGPQSWEYEGEFMKRCNGVGNNNIGKYREQFAKHIVIIKMAKSPKCAWFADPKVAARARG